MSTMNHNKGLSSCIRYSNLNESRFRLSLENSLFTNAEMNASQLELERVASLTHIPEQGGEPSYACCRKSNKMCRAIEDSEITELEGDVLRRT